MKMNPKDAAEILDRIRDEDSYTEKAFNALTLAINMLNDWENCIDRKEAVKKLLYCTNECENPAFFAKIIHKMPAKNADAYQKEEDTTKWLKAGTTSVKCKKCEHVYPLFVGFEEFCPHCGRKAEKF